MGKAKPEALDTKGSGINIQHCPACDGPHENLELNQFNHDNPPWTHWFSCPTLKDPVPLTLLAIGRDGMEIRNDVVLSVARGAQANNYMAAIFRVEGGKLLLERHTQHFDPGNFSKAVELLKQNLEDEVGPPREQPEQDDSQELRPLVNLFGPPNGE